MSSLDWKALNCFAEKGIASFHQKRLDSLQKLKLKTVLKRKNPYLFKAKNQLTASDLVKTLLDAHLYLLAIKSGPNWGNSGQIKKMQDNFAKARKILHTGNSKLHVQAVNGCCYGQDNRPNKSNYRKLCGQRFWAFISDDEALYTRLIGPIGHRAKEKNEDFLKQYAKVTNLFAQEFMQVFCVEGEIDWVKLVEFNSGNKGEKDVDG